MPTEQPVGNTKQLILGTGAFALCFAVFGKRIGDDACHETTVSSCSIAGQHRVGRPSVTWELGKDSTRAAD